MSWDLYVQDWGDFDSLEQIPDDFEPKPIGNRSELIDRIKAAEPTVNFKNPSWGLLENEFFSIEFNMGDSELSDGFVLHVRGNELAIPCISNILYSLNLKAADGSTPDFFDVVKSKEDMKKWADYRNSIISDLNPNEIFLFKVDNWFDTKWLNFTGKVLGALGTWNFKDKQRIPPFSPNRILEQGYFQKDKLGTYIMDDFEVEIHKRQSVEKNLSRRIVDVSDSAIFIWYSSNTTKNEQGSLMIYHVENRECNSLYVGFKKNHDWEIVKAPGSNKKALEFYLERNQ